MFDDRKFSITMRARKKFEEKCLFQEIAERVKENWERIALKEEMKNFCIKDKI